MLNLPYYDINRNKEYQYSYLLHILIRITRLSEVNKITRVDFISACLKLGIAKRTAFDIWNKGAYKNMFIKFVSKDKNTLYIKSLKSFKLIIEKVPEYMYKNITGIVSLKDFLHTAFLGRSGIKEVKTGKGLNTIATQQNTTVKTVCKRNKRSRIKFGLEKNNRYGVYNNLLIRLTNTYNSAVRIVKNRYYAVNELVKNKVNICFNNFASLSRSLITEIDKKLEYANKSIYETINVILYPKIL